MKSVRYAQLGTEAAARSRSTAAVLLASGEARALAALNRLEEAHIALARAADARDRVQPDSVERVRTALSAITDPGRDVIELAGAIEAFTAERLT